MSRTIYVNCPCCDALMEIDTESGAIVQKWSAREKAGSGDKMGDALKKLEEGKKRRANLLDQMKSELEDQKKKSDDVFRKEVDRVKKEGLKDGPQRPFDLD